MSQTQIIIASVLKPLKDPRLYSRFAFSLRETNKYLINIIGFSTKKESDEKNIKFHPVFWKKRNHPSRILVSLRLIRIIIKVQPKLVIITTFEILPVAILGKWLIGYKLIYDRRENYILNLEQNKTLKGWKKKLSKGLVSFIEYCSNPFIDHNFFAEKVYQKEFPKVGKHTIFQNKYFDRGNDIKPIKLNANKKLRFIISGTITEVYGIIEGVSWFQSIIAYYPSAILTVIGHAPMKEYLQKILKINIDPRSIRLQISEIPVPYSDILEAYQETEIVLLPYHQIPSISPKIPSKLYESIALGKPCLFQHNQLWESICTEYPAGKGIDFLDIENAKSNLDKFLQTIFFEKKPGEEVLWKSDEAKFLEVVARLTNKL